MSTLCNFNKFEPAPESKINNKFSLCVARCNSIVCDLLFLLSRTYYIVTAWTVGVPLHWSPLPCSAEENPVRFPDIFLYFYLETLIFYSRLLNVPFSCNNCISFFKNEFFSLVKELKFKINKKSFGSRS